MSQHECIYDIINIPNTVLKKELEKVLQSCKVPYTSIKAYILDDNFFNSRITTSSPSSFRGFKFRDCSQQQNPCIPNKPL